MSKDIVIEDATYHVSCNWQTRELHMFADLPRKGKLREQFKYIEIIEEYDARLFQYRGSWYDLHEFEVPQRGFNGSHIQALGFDAWQAESYFSAVVVAYPRDEIGDPIFDDDEIIVGHIHW